MVQFTIPGTPQGKARARTFRNKYTGKSQSITPEKTVLYENWIKDCYLSATDEKWLDKQPLSMSIMAFFEIPKSTTKKDRKLIETGALHPVKKPDADNIAKVVCDALNGVAYKDDTQITMLTISKHFAKDCEPCVIVTINTQ